MVDDMFDDIPTSDQPQPPAPLPSRAPLASAPSPMDDAASAPTAVAHHWWVTVVIAVLLGVVMGGGTYAWYQMQIGAVQNGFLDQQQQLSAKKAALQQELTTLQSPVTPAAK